MAESKKHKITIARASEPDFESLRNFLHLSENLMERRYGMGEPASDWEQWDEDDPDRLELIQLRAEVARYEGIRADEVDKRVIFYELLRLRFAAASTGWRRVFTMAQVWDENAQDPQKTYIDWLPGLEYQHVSNEQ